MNEFKEEKGNFEIIDTIGEPIEENNEQLFETKNNIEENDADIDFEFNPVPPFSSLDEEPVMVEETPVAEEVSFEGFNAEPMVTEEPVMVEETPIDPLDEEIKDLKEKIRTTRDEIDKEIDKVYSNVEELHRMGFYDSEYTKDTYEKLQEAKIVREKFDETVEEYIAADEEIVDDTKTTSNLDEMIF